MKSKQLLSLFLRFFSDKRNDSIGEIGKIKMAPSESFLSIFFICKQIYT